MRILIADKLAPEGAKYLESIQGMEVTTQTGLAGSELAVALMNHDGVVIRSAVQITADVLNQCAAGGQSKLKAIARAGVGVDNIDLPTATSMGILVMNSASASTITTAEHAFALMIALARNIAPAHIAIAGGGWDRSKFTGIQLHGKTLGIVGMGRIGTTLAQRAIAFGMKVIGHDPFINATSTLDDQVQLYQSFEEMLSQVDVVSFHVPKTDVTAKMLNSKAFEAVKPGGILVINAARGGIVDEEDLLEALESGKCIGAALDVYESEPPPENSPLRNHPKILTTPHLGASTVEAQEAVAVGACQALATYLSGEGMIGAVNAGGLVLDLSDRQQAFVDLSGQMIALLHAAIGDEPLSSVKITVRGEALAGAADTIARFALAQLLSQHLDEPVNVINAGLIAEQRHIDLQTIIASDQGEDRLAIELKGTGYFNHKVQGAIYEDGLPRITHLDGYAMDMVPAGHMVLLTNKDEPGRIGMVGQLFGNAKMNIAEMVIGRKLDTDTSQSIAMMILKLDAAPPEVLLEELRSSPGILRVADVALSS